MDAPICLSHKTAWLLYHASGRFDVLERKVDYGIHGAAPMPKRLADCVAHFLADCGVPAQELETIDSLVSFAFERSHPGGSFRIHSLGMPVPADNLVELVPGLLVVDPRLCFVQAASWLNELELIEFGYELCGSYELPVQATTAEAEPRDGGTVGYTVRRPLTTRVALQEFVKGHSGFKGSRAAAKALVRVRDGSRSPMETAAALAIVMPRCRGGLGFKGVELNYRVDIPDEFRSLTASGYFEVDIFAPRKNAGVEYDGGAHAEASRRAHDAERLATLNAMGMRIQTLTKGQFANQLAFHRAMNAIARMFGIKADASLEFQRAQNELRQALIRSWALGS